MKHIKKPEDTKKLPWTNVLRGDTLDITTWIMTLPNGVKIKWKISIPEWEEQEALQKYWNTVRSAEKT